MLIISSILLSTLDVGTITYTSVVDKKTWVLKSLSNLHMVTQVTNRATIQNSELLMPWTSISYPLLTTERLCHSISSYRFDDLEKYPKLKILF